MSVNAIEYFAGAHCFCASHSSVTNYYDNDMQFSAAKRDLSALGCARAFGGMWKRYLQLKYGTMRLPI